MAHMKHEFQPRTLPNEHDYATAADAVQGAMDEKGLSAKLYLPSLSLATNSAKEFSRNAARLANAVEPTTPETGVYVDASRRRGRAVYLGAIAGYSILREIYGVSLPSETMFEYMPPLLINVVEGDVQGNTNALYEAILDTGIEGSGIFGSYAVGRVTQWSEQAVSRPEYRRTFVAGAGMIALAGVDMQTKRIEQFHIDRLHEHVESNESFDWDAALLELNSKES